MRDLFRTPRQRPASVLPVRLVQPLPLRRLGPDDDAAIRPAHVPSEALLHVLMQPGVRDQLGGLRSFGCLLCLPLRNRGPVLGPAAPGRRVTAQLTRDRARVPSEAAGDLPHALALRTQDRDLLPFVERQIPARGLVQADRRHPASVAKPTGSDRPGHAHPQRRFGGGDASSDQSPELPLHRPRRLRPPRRTHRRTQRPIRAPLPTRRLRHIARLRNPVLRRHR